MNGAGLLAVRLSELGVQRVFGESLPGPDPWPSGVTHVPVGDPDLAVLLADADGRIGEVDGAARLGAALLAGPILHLSSEPGGLAPLQTVGSADEMLDALVDPPGRLLPGTSALHLDFDLTAELSEGTAATAQPEQHAVMTLDPTMAGLRLLVVVGPGVVRARAFAGLRSLSRTTGAGVLNTWGAKGVERWDSPWHFGTVGLQARDLALAGVGDVDVVITSGLDPAELPGGVVPHPVVQDVHPAQLGALCQAWSTAADPPGRRPPLYDQLASVLQPLYEHDGAPLSPARAALHLSGALPDRGMCVADPGPAGLWVARAFPTSIPNSVCVPATVTPGFAAAAALCCRLEGRPVLAVTDAGGAAELMTGAVLELADSIGTPVALQVWTEDAVPGWSSAADHVALLQDQLTVDPVSSQGDTVPSRIDIVPVALGDTDALVAVAGEPAAWA